MPSFSAKILALAVLATLVLTFGGTAHPAAAQDTGSISGRVIHDLNGDGVAQADEPGLGGWLVAFYSADLPRYEATTPSDGSFEFKDVVPGTYSLGAHTTEETRAPNHWVFSSPTVTSFDGWVVFSSIEVAPGADEMVDVGVLSLEGTGSISGEVYWDTNGNGVRDVEEQPAVCDCWAGLAVYLPGGYALVEPDRGMDVPGSQFNFQGLGPADYRVALLFGPGVPTAPAVNAYGWPEHRVTLAEGEERGGLEYGFVPRPEEPPEIEPGGEINEPPPEEAGDMTVPATGEGWVTVGHDAVVPTVGLLALFAVGGCCFAVGGAFLVGRRRRARFRR